MKCREIEDKLNAYLEDFLQNEERDVIEKHCAGCNSCRHSLESLKKTKDILKELDEIEPPAWLTQKIMARIYEQKEREGWFQRFFLPLRVKIPIQALAMAFVVVLSVYVYRSTTPELAHLDLPQQAPRASGAVDGTARTQAAPKEDIKPGPKPKERKKASPVEKAPQQPTEKAPERPVPGKQDSISRVEPGDAGILPVRSAKGAASDYALKKESMGPAALPPSPAAIERYKTRGMMIQEDKSSEYQSAAGNMSQKTSDRITVTAANPSDAARKARRILTSLSAGEIRERTENDSVIISCLIDPGSIPELRNRIAGIAEVIEGSTRITTGLTAPQYVEIIILRDSRNP
jgi:hypothetical protein